MKGCVEWIPVYSSEDFNSSGLELGTALFLGVLLLKLYRATETNGKVIVLGVPILKHRRVRQKGVLMLFLGMPVFVNRNFIKGGKFLSWYCILTT